MLYFIILYFVLIRFFLHAGGESLTAHRMQVSRCQRFVCNANVLEKFATVSGRWRRPDEEVQSSAAGAHGAAPKESQFGVETVSMVHKAQPFLLFLC